MSSHFGFERKFIISRRYPYKMAVTPNSGAILDFTWHSRHFKPKNIALYPTLLPNKVLSNFWAAMFERNFNFRICLFWVIRLSLSTGYTINQHLNNYLKLGKPTLECLSFLYLIATKTRWNLWSSPSSRATKTLTHLRWGTDVEVSPSYLKSKSW